jgi:hypothetical protein
MKIVRLVAAVLLGLSVVLGLGACSALQSAFSLHNLPSLQTQIGTQCDIVNGDLTTLGKSPLLTVDQQTTLNQKVIPANKAFCSAVASANVTATDAKTLHDQILPLAIGIVSGLPPSPQQTAILLGLNTFGPMIQQEVDQIIMSTAASAPAAASAPVAASTPLTAAPLQ